MMCELNNEIHLLHTSYKPIWLYAAMQSQKTVSAYFTIEQIMSFAFEEQYEQNTFDKNNLCGHILPI